jgi:hypothetical protein
MAKFNARSTVAALCTGAALFLVGTVAPVYAQQQLTERPLQQGQPVQQKIASGGMQQHRTHGWRAEHRTWRQRGGYTGYRIPEDHFRVNFGRQHRFRIHSAPLLNSDGYPRFQYNGYWFSLVDPWPQYWSQNWYETDDVYVRYSRGGYYLYNRRHPGARIAVRAFEN